MYIQIRPVNGLARDNGKSAAPDGSVGGRGTYLDGPGGMKGSAYTTLSVSRPGRGILFAQHPCRGHPIYKGGRRWSLCRPSRRRRPILSALPSGWPHWPAPTFSTPHGRGSFPRVPRPAGFAAGGGRGFERSVGGRSDGLPRAGLHPDAGGIFPRAGPMSR
jgi:hypothetical protein